MSKTKTAPDAVKAQNAAALAQQQQRSEQQALDYFNAMDNFYIRQYSDEVNKSTLIKFKKISLKMHS